MPAIRLLAPALGVTASLLIAAPVLSAETNRISIPMDEVRVITFATPVKTVYVGNPTIADITVIDATHVFLQGKSFGTTNMLALDNAGHQVVEERVTVLPRQEATVTVQRGGARTTLNCAALRCEASPTPGDDAGPFDAVSGQVDRHQTQNKAAAVAETGQK